MGGIIHSRSRNPVRGQRETRFDLWRAGGSEDVLSGSIEYMDDLAGGAFLLSASARDAEDSIAGNGETIANSAWSDRSASFRPSDRWRSPFALSHRLPSARPSACESHVSQSIDLRRLKPCRATQNGLADKAASPSKKRREKESYGAGAVSTRTMVGFGSPDVPA